MAVDMNKYMENLKKAGATIKPPGGIPASGYGQVMGAARAKDGLQPYQAPASPLTLPSGTVGSPNISTGMAGAYAAPKGPVYGANISGFDSNNATHKQIADFGTQWSQATNKADKDRIASESLKLGTTAGGIRDASGKWSFANPGTINAAASPTVEQTDPNALATEEYMNELKLVSKSIMDGIDQSYGSANQQVGWNNQSLQENIKALNEKKAVTDDNIVTFQNRRGGFYSGGTDYQLGNNSRGFAEAEGGLRRDTETRNANIWTNHNQLAQQAKDKIALLTQQAPAKIRELIMGKQEKDRDFALRESGVTGMYNGQPTPDGIAQSLTNEINRLKLQQLPAELKLGLTALENDVSLGKLNLQEAQIKLKELQDPNSITNKARTLALEADRLGNQELKKRIEFIGYKPPMTDAEARLQQIELDKAEIELTNLKNGGSEKYSGMTANQIMDSVRSKYSETQYGPSNILGQPGPKVGEKLTSDPAKREQMFLEVVDSGLPSDTETMQVLRLLGLSKEEIDRYVKKHSGN